MDTVIQTQGLTRFFGGKKVVDRLDLAVPKGAICALLGDNGAGKSTTIRMLTGLLPASAGSATILGLDCWKSAITLRHRVGYVPERPRFYDWMTVREIGAFAAGFHHAGYRERYLLLAERFRLDADTRLKALSKGGYAKVGLALALATDPEVLILDEPTSGLDLFTRREFLASMVELAGDGRTILISSHAVAELERVASHAVFLAEGKLLLAGSLEELRRRLLRIRIRHDGSMDDPVGLGTLLDQESTRREWQGVVQDADRSSIEAVRQRAGVLDVDEGQVSLEDMYTALLARFHHRGGRNGRADITQTDEAAEASEKGER